MQNIISCFLKGYLNSTQSLEAKVTSLEAKIPKIDAAIKNIKNDTISSLNSHIEAIQEDIAGLKLNDTHVLAVPLHVGPLGDLGHSLDMLYNGLRL